MSVLDLLIKDLQRHTVGVRLPGDASPRDLCLIEVTALTSTYDDFCMSYPGASQIALRLARKRYGEREEWSTYGVFVDPVTVRYVYAFNRAFAKYDEVRREVVFTEVERIMESMVEEAPDPPPPTPQVTRIIHETVHVQPSVVFRYAILGGRE